MKLPLARFTAIIILLFCIVPRANAQAGNHILSGHIRNGATGEALAGATVYVLPAGTGTTSNALGFYSLALPEGKHSIGYNFLGYSQHEEKIELAGNTTLDISLVPEAVAIDNIVVNSVRPNANVVMPEMSTAILSAQAIKSIPALMGEVDIVKAIQLMPGVQSVAEGSTGFSVRGSNYDQNLILLDDATIYNTSHLMGFFSVFNNDVVQDVKLYKGDMPAAYGGRLSSLLDVQTRDGNDHKFAFTGGIGLISSRLALEGPLVKEKVSVIAAGRRSYFEVFKPFSKELKDKTAHFYDLNLKVAYKINPNNRITLSGYMGDDKYGMEGASLDFGNKAYSLRWSHVFNWRFNSVLTFTGSKYNYDISTRFVEQVSEKATSEMGNYGLKADLTHTIGYANRLNFGYHILRHSSMPGHFRGTGNNNILATMRLPENYALEQAAYISNETKIREKLILKYGLRFTGFHNISNGKPVNYLENYMVAHTETYVRGRIYNNQYSWEPRLGVLYAFNDRNSVKASYTRTSQFIQMASNSSAGSPLDVWFQASQNVRPQLSDQYSLGYYRNFADNEYELSVEAYYKDFRNAIDFKDHADLVLNENIEEEFRFGTGYAYGFEVMLRKNGGRLNGWISYSFARSMKKIDEVNNEKWYRSPFDKPINISIVASYRISPEWTVSGTWVCYSGTPTTFPEGRYRIENNYVPIYGERNTARFPTYHRLDLSATWTLSKPESKFYSDLNFSIYNVYGRKNPWMVYFKWDEATPDTLYGEMMYLFAFVPSVTWNFKF